MVGGSGGGEEMVREVVVEGSEWKSSGRGMEGSSMGEG